MTEYLGLQYSDATASTLAGLKQKIYFDCHCNSESVSDGDLNRIINDYYAQLQDALRAVNENFYLGIATTDLVIGDGTYTFPDGTGSAPAYEKIKQISVAYQPKDIIAPLDTEYQVVNIVDPTYITDPAYIFSQPTAMIFGNYFVLKPLVTDATKYPVTDGVKMYYIMRQDKLSTDTDIPKVFPSFHSVIALGAEIDVNHRLGDDEGEAKAKKDFADGLERMKAYASNHLPPELGVVEGQDELGGWEYPWGNNSMS
jgi:hypothetical protein